MDKVAKRPRGFAFVSYAVEEEAKSAIEGMHGKVRKKKFRSLCVCVCQTICQLAAHLFGICKWMKSILPPEVVKESRLPPELQYQEWNPLQLLKPDKSPPLLVFTVVLAVGPTCQPTGPTCHPLLSLSLSPSLLSLSLSHLFSR